MRVLRTLAVVGVAALAPMANASPVVTTWSYQVDSIFSAATFTAGLGPTTGAPGLTLAWGNAALQSSLVISATPAIDNANPGAINPGGELVTAIGHLPTYNPGEIGLTQIFTHNNFTIPLNSAFLDEATVTTTLLLTPQTPNSNTAEAFPPLPISVNFKETPNAGPCAPPGAPNGACPDIFVIDGGLDLPFWYNSDAPGGPLVFADPVDPANFVRYFIQIFPLVGNVPTPLNFLSSAQCIEAGVASGVCQGFITPEGGVTNQQFGFAITTEPVLRVPEPGTLALFALALVGLGFSARRRQA